MRPAPSIVKFALGLGVIYGLLYFAYGAVPDQVLRSNVYFVGLVQPSASLVNFLGANESARAVMNQLISPRAVLEIVRGCDGSGALFLLIAAMLTFPATWRLKTLGIIAGAGAIYVLNLMRLVGLYFVAAYKPAWFLPLHTYFIPTLLIVLVCLLFMGWTALATRPRDATTYSA